MHMSRASGVSCRVEAMRVWATSSQYSTHRLTFPGEHDHALRPAARTKSMTKSKAVAAEVLATFTRPRAANAQRVVVFWC